MDDHCLRREVDVDLDMSAGYVGAAIRTYQRQQSAYNRSPMSRPRLVDCRHLKENQLTDGTASINLRTARIPEPVSAPPSPRKAEIHRTASRPESRNRDPEGPRRGLRPPRKLVGQQDEARAPIEGRPDRGKAIAPHMRPCALDPVGEKLDGRDVGEIGRVDPAGESTPWPLSATVIARQCAVQSPSDSPQGPAHGTATQSTWTCN